MFELKRATPEAVGIPSASLENLIRQLDQFHIPMHSLLVMRHGKLVLEAYYSPFTADTLHRMYSITKSFSSLGIGLLEADGKISLQDLICSYFPEYVTENTHPWIREMTIEHLLKMSTCHDMTTYKKTSTTENWVESFFKKEPTHRPGTVFMYDTSASHTLCALVEKLTGMDLLDFLKSRFLRRIGVAAASYILKDPFGVSMGGTGLMLRPAELLRVGMLLMNQGKDPARYGEADAEQIYPADYIRKATAFQTSTAVNSLRENGYGYQFWRIPHDGYACLGMGGQALFCYPKEDVICVMTADTQNVPGAGDDIYPILENTLFAGIAEGNTKGTDALLEDPAAVKRLAEVCRNLSIPVLNGFWKGETVEQQINGKLYHVEQRNGYPFTQFSALFGDGGGELRYTMDHNTYRLPFGFGNLKESLFPAYDQKCASSAAWVSSDTLYIRSWLVDECIASIYFKLHFGADGTLTIRMKKTEETKFNEYQGILTCRMLYK